MWGGWIGLVDDLGGGCRKSWESVMLSDMASDSEFHSAIFDLHSQPSYPAWMC